VTDGFDLVFGAGYTDSEIKEAADPATVGNQAPLVSEYTVNVGGQYRRPIAAGLNAFLRMDFQQIGDTYWDPQNSTVRDPVDLLDARLGIEGDRWSLIAWGKNLNNKQYNAEFSPGGFVFKAKPRRYGIDFVRRF
jgi:iron complex outermembrane receptor protein